MNTLYVTRAELGALREISAACVLLNEGGFDEGRWLREVNQLLGMVPPKGTYRVEVVERVVVRYGLVPPGPPEWPEVF